MSASAITCERFCGAETDNKYLCDNRISVVLVMTPFLLSRLVPSLTGGTGEGGGGGGGGGTGKADKLTLFLA